MRGSITLHPEHGVNPSLGVCFWCGGDDGTVLLLGLNKGKEAAHRTCVGYDPCDTCKKNWERGVVVIEATDDQPDDDRPEIQSGLYPTGSWAVMTKDAVLRLFDGDSGESAIRHGKAYINKEAWDQLGLDDEPQGEQEVSGS